MNIIIIFETNQLKTFLASIPILLEQYNIVWTSTDKIIISLTF